MIRFSLLTALFVLIFSAIGCAPNQGQTPHSEQADLEDTAISSNPKLGLPWPPASDSPHLTSAQYQNFNGTDYSIEGGSYNAAVPGTDVFILAMDPLEISYAVYPLAVPANERPVSLDLTIGNNEDVTQPLDPPLPYWIGVSNFHHDAWEISGPYSTYTEQYTYNNSAARNVYVSTGDVTYIVIIAYDDGNPPSNRYPAIINGRLELTGDPANIPPDADLTVSDEVILTGETATWDASASTDSDGSIVDYEWDLDNDGTYNEPGTDEETYRGQSQITIEYNPPRFDIVVSVRVSDDDGSSDSVAAGLRLNRDPIVYLGTSQSKIPVGQLATVNVTSEEDFDGSITEIIWDFNENGAFNESGAEAAAYDLRTVQVTVPRAGTFQISCQPTDNDGGTSESVIGITGTGWATYDVFSVSGGTTPESLDIIGCETGPMIAFINLGELVISIGNPAGSGWASSPLASVGSGTAYCSLELVQEHPAVAYYQSDDKDLYYAWSDSVSGADPTDWTHVGVDTLGWDVGQFCDLAVVNGQPAIACFEATNEVAYYAYSTDDNGIGTWGGYPVDGSPKTGILPSLSSVEGKPVMCYGNYTSFLEEYAYTSKLQGLPVATWTSNAFTTAGEMNFQSIMLPADTYPLYCKISADSRRLKIFKGADLAGSTWQDNNVFAISTADIYPPFDADIIAGMPVAASQLSSSYDEVRVWRSQTNDGMTSPWVQAGDSLPVVQNTTNDLAITEYRNSIAVAIYSADSRKITYSYLYE